jgi:hypothetical protein
MGSEPALALVDVDGAPRARALPHFSEFKFLFFSLQYLCRNSEPNNKGSEGKKRRERERVRGKVGFLACPTCSSFALSPLSTPPSYVLCCCSQARNGCRQEPEHPGRVGWCWGDLVAPCRVCSLKFSLDLVLPLCSHSSGWTVVAQHCPTRTASPAEH